MRTRSIARGVLAVAVTGLLGITWTGTASADASGTVIRKADTTEYPTMKLTVMKPSTATDTDQVQITENGHVIANPTTQTVKDAGTPIGVVLAIDTSEAMNTGNAMNKTKAAAKEMVKAMAPNEQIAIIAFGTSSRLVSNFTNSPDTLNASIDNLATSGNSALWDGVDSAGTLLAERPDLQPNVVVIAGSANTASGTVTYQVARSQIRNVKAEVFPIVIQQEVPVSAAALQDLVSASSGRYLSTANSDDVTALLNGVQSSLLGQVEVTYNSPGGDDFAIVASVGGSAATAQIAKGTVSQGDALTRQLVARSPLPGFLQGKVFIIIVAAVSLLMVGLLIFGISEIVFADRNQLMRALRPYSDDPAEVERDFTKLADSAFIKRAVAETGRIANERGLLVKVQLRLEQADLPLRPAEALFFTGLVAMIAMIAGVAFGGILGLIGAAAVFAVFPVALTGGLAKRRRKKFTSQLPATLQLLAGSLRAGYSLVQGLDAVAKQTEAPMCSELQRAMSEARLGRPVEDALQDISDRMGSPDFEWAVMAIKIQREVGGNLAELLMTVADTMVQRERLRREVKGLTAEGRISAWVLCALPPMTCIAAYVLNPTYITPFFHSLVGQVAIGGSVVMLVVGYLVMMKMVDIEV